MKGKYLPPMATEEQENLITREVTSFLNSNLVSEANLTKLDKKLAGVFGRVLERSPTSPKGSQSPRSIGSRRSNASIANAFSP